MPTTTGRTTRKANAGSFRKGADPRRHVHTPACGHELYKFTAEDCSTGFFVAIASYVEQGGNPRNFLRNKFRARGQAFTPRGRRSSR